MKLAKLLFLISIITYSIIAQEIPDNKYFWIQSVQEAGKTPNGCWDVPGHPAGIKEGEIQNIQVWGIDNDPDRLFKFDEQDENEYKIIPKHGEADCCMRIENNSRKNGTSIVIAEEDNDEELETFVLNYKGNGIWRIKSLAGRIVCLAARSSANGSNVHMWDEHPGTWTEWCLIDPMTRKVFIPAEEDDKEDLADESFEGMERNSGLGSDINSSESVKMTGPEAEKVVKNIDQTYKELYSFETRLAKVNNKLEKANKVLNKTSVVSGNLNSLTSKINRSYDALMVFTKIPVVGPAVTGLRTTVGIAKGKIEGVNNKVKSLERPVVRPACEGFESLSGVTGTFDDKVVSLCTELKTVRSSYTKASGCAAGTTDQNLINSFEQKSAVMNQRLDDINKELSSMNAEIEKIEKMADAAGKIEGPVKTADKGIKAVEKVFNKTDKAAKKIDDVLNKRFKKKILGKKIDISVKDIISGGKVGKAFKQAAEKWAKKLLNPVMKKLNIKIPEIPGMDKIANEVSNMKNSINQFPQIKAKLEDFAAKTEAMKNSLNSQLNECKNGLPCK